MPSAEGPLPLPAGIGSIKVVVDRGSRGSEAAVSWLGHAVSRGCLLHHGVAVPWHAAIRARRTTGGHWLLHVLDDLEIINSVQWSYDSQ